jgi:uncharacterized membrane protein
MSEQDNEILEQTGDADNTKENENADKGLDPKTLLAQKEHFKEKFQKKEEEVEALKRELDSFKTFKQPNTEVKSNVSEERLEAIEFALKHPEIDSKISTEILEVARAKGIKPEEAVELPYFKTYIEKQEEERASSGGVQTSNRSPKFTPQKPIEEMSKDEHRKWASQYGVK